MSKQLIVKITDTAFPKTMVIPISDRITFGRSDLDDPHSHPDIDLVACNAISNGISRNHAALERQPDGEFMLYDLNSRNGTFIGDMQLDPHLPYPVTHGDNIRLGKLAMTLLFE